MDKYKAIVCVIYFLLLSGFSAHFVHLIEKCGEKGRIRGFNFKLFRLAAFLNWGVGGVALITSLVRPEAITRIIPDSGSSIFPLSLVMAFPLNSFYLYFKRRLSNETDQDQK